MTLTRVLFPAVEFDASYFAARGRPWSPLEWLILRAVSADARTVVDLVALLQIHQRLVIEALVTLTLEGWLAVSSGRDEEFVLSVTGRKAAGRKEAPKSHERETQERHAIVAREQLTAEGALYTRRALRTYSDSELAMDSEWADAIRLPIDDSLREEIPDAARIAPLLFLPKSHWIDSKIRVGLASGTRWAKLFVDPESGAFVGADHLGADLRLTILKSLGIDSRPDTASSGALIVSQGQRSSSSKPLVPTAPAEIRREDLLCTEDEHTAYLLRALSQARSLVFLASAFVSESAIGALRRPIIEALQRGVRVELLGGYVVFEEGALRILQDLTPTLNTPRGLLHCNVEHPAGAHAKILLWDLAEDVVEVCIGSFNWLSADPEERRGFSGSNVSVAVRTPSVVTHVARYIGELWASAEPARLNSRQWEDLARSQGAISEDRVPSAPNAQIRIVFDREHDSLFRSWVVSATERFLVASHKMGNPTASRFFPGLERATPIPDCRVLYAELIQPEMVEVQRRVEDTLTRMGAVNTQLPWLHSKVIIGDSRACISSYNFLSASGSAPKGHRELGLLVEPGSAPAAGSADERDPLWDLDDVGSGDEIDGPDIHNESSTARDQQAATAIHEITTHSPASAGEAARGAEESVDSASTTIPNTSRPRCEVVEWLWAALSQA